MPVRFICGHCGKEFYVKQSRAARGNVQYCSQSCYDAVRVTRTLVICDSCGKEFTIKPRRLNESMSGLQFCNQDCYGRWRTGKHFGAVTVPSEQLIAEYIAGASLRELGEKHGLSESTVSAHIKKGRKAGSVVRVRTVTTVVRNANKRPGIKGEANSRFIPLPDEELMVAYENGLTTVELGHQYGVSDVKIQRRLKAMGLSLRSGGYSGGRHTCTDGHIVDSRLEYAVDEWLYTNGIPHTPHPLVPWACKPSFQRADFLVGTTYIEIWGLMGIASYEKNRLEKLAKYQAHGIHLIELFPEQIHSADYSPLLSLLIP